ncbi:hypothetical protein OG423_32155 [Micromonospora zamorensis]|uniref:hypothetical protein n=1 Tax=Micromonospora zamorensis TaxID=709883 RepID=UPI00352B236E|nr:hypothetical protein OG423_32155 [Micromonospora zamorensis]
MKPHVTYPLLYAFVLAHLAHLGTYQGLPDAALPEPVSAAWVAPTWERPPVQPRYDSEDPTGPNVVRLTLNTAPAVTGAAFTLGHPELGQLGWNGLG